jgi:putative sigma-54 modulation protein
MRIHLRGIGDKLDSALAAYAERRLLFALGRFGGRIGRVTLRLEDTNGPRGGVDKRCHIELRLVGAGSLVVDTRDTAFEPAISRAADRMARRVREHLTMKRTVRRRRSTTGGDGAGQPTPDETISRDDTWDYMTSGVEP